MAEITKITTPMLPKENIGNKYKPTTDQAFELSDPSKVHKSSQEGKVNDQQRQSQANLGLNMGRAMMEPLMRETVEISHIFQKMVSMMQVGISASEAMQTEELKDALNSLFVPADKLAALVKEQSDASVLFKGEAFDALRDIIDKFPETTKLREAVANILKTFEQNLNSEKSMKAIISNCTNMLDYMFTKDREQFGAYLDGLAKILLPESERATHTPSGQPLPPEGENQQAQGDAPVKEGVQNTYPRGGEGTNPTPQNLPSTQNNPDRPNTAGQPAGELPNTAGQPAGELPSPDGSKQAEHAPAPAPDGNHPPVPNADTSAERPNTNPDANTNANANTTANPNVNTAPNANVSGNPNVPPDANANTRPSSDANPLPEGNARPGELPSQIPNQPEGPKQSQGQGPGPDIKHNPETNPRTEAPRNYPREQPAPRVSDQREAVGILKNNLLPLLGEIVNKYHQNTAMRDTVMVVVHNIVRVDQGTPEMLERAVADLVRELKQVANLPEGFERKMITSLLKARDAAPDIPNNTLDKMARIISETLRNPEAPPAQIRQSEMLLLSLLQNQNSLMNVLHFVVPIMAPDGSQVVAELYVDPDSEEKSRKGSSERSNKVFMSFDSERHGSFEMSFLQTGEYVDFNLWCPSGLVKAARDQRRQLADMMLVHGYTMTGFEVAEFIEPHSVGEVFPALLRQKVGMDVVV